MNAKNHDRKLEYEYVESMRLNREDYREIFVDHGVICSTWTDNMMCEDEIGGRTLCKCELCDMMFCDWCVKNFWNWICPVCNDSSWNTDQEE